MSTTSGKRSSAGIAGSIVGIFHNPFTAWVILALSLVITYFAYTISATYAFERSKDRFLFRTEKITSDIKDRMKVYEQVLWGTVGFFNATGRVVSRQEFKSYVDTLSINEHWPGIQGIGFSVPVSADQKEAHIQSMRAEGFTDYTIKPAGQRSSYSSIIYLEPFDWRNKRAFGYDMWSNDMRREAMTRARDEGVAATSGIITLVQETNEDVQRGFLTYLPLYKKTTDLKSVEARREAFLGWVYSPFRAGDLMQGIVGDDDPNIEFEIFDGPEVNAQSLLYDSNKVFHLDEINHNPVFEKRVTLNLQGRQWTVVMNTPRGYSAVKEAKHPKLVAIGAIIVDILLFYVIWSIYFLQAKANAIAVKMTEEIRSKTDELEKAKRSLEEEVNKRTGELQDERNNLEKRVSERTSELQEKMSELEVINEAMVGRELKIEELKKENKELKARLRDI